MEEKKEKNKVSLILVILIGLVVAGAFGYACYEIGKKETSKDNKQIEEKQKEKIKDEEQLEEENEDSQLYEKTVIIDVAQITNIKQDDLHGIYEIANPSDKITCQVSKSGVLNSECLTEDLKNKKIVDVAFSSRDFDDSIYVLDETGIIYLLKYDDNVVSTNISKELEINKKVSEIGIIPDYLCNKIDELTYKIDDEMYVNSVNINEHTLYSMGICTAISTDLQQVLLHYNGTLSLDDKFIIDQDTNEKVVIDYSILEAKSDNEKLYLVGRNKKFYILDEFQEKVKSYSSIEELNFYDEKTDDIYTKLVTGESDKIYIKLANGESFEFINEYQ